MVFRLPTHLDTFIPPPSLQAGQNRPWRGTLTVRGVRTSDTESSQEIRVTAVETDGDSNVRSWPSQFFAQVTHGRPILREVRAWIRQNTPPISTFMPDRHPDPNTNVVNQTNFRSLSRILFEHQLVAIAPWGTNHFTGGGIIIIPAEHSSALLVAALFFSQFPEIINAPSDLTSTPIVTQSPHNIHHPFTQSMTGPSTTSYSSASYSPGSYASGSQQHSVSRQIPSTSTVRRPHGSLSPVEQAISRSRQESFRAIMPRESPTHHPDMSTAPSWPAVKDEDREEYSPYSAHQSSQHHSHYQPQPSPRSN